jgi:hypothetical protein
LGWKQKKKKKKKKFQIKNPLQHPKNREGSGNDDKIFVIFQIKEKFEDIRKKSPWETQSY